MTSSYIQDFSISTISYFRFKYTFGSSIKLNCNGAAFMKRLCVLPKQDYFSNLQALLKKEEAEENFLNKKLTKYFKTF